MPSDVMIARAAARQWPRRGGRVNTSTTCHFYSLKSRILHLIFEPTQRKKGRQQHIVSDLLTK
jgi:hypothetical protein